MVGKSVDVVGTILNEALGGGERESRVCAAGSGFPFISHISRILLHNKHFLIYQGLYIMSRRCVARMVLELSNINWKRCMFPHAFRELLPA